MQWKSYIPGKSTLLLFEKTAIARLGLYSARVRALPNSRIASATEQINPITNDIGEPLGHPVASRSEPAPLHSHARDVPPASAAPAAAGADLNAQGRFLETLLDNLPF